MLSYLKLLPDRSYPDVSDIDAKLLKIVAVEITASLAYVFNLSMTQSIVT